MNIYLLDIFKLLYRKHPLTLLISIAALLFLSHLDVLLVNIMEARNFITAREMLTHNNWIFTTINELPRYEKPPLPTWLTAFSAAIFGIKSLFAYRLPAALVSIFMIFTFYKIQQILDLHKSISFGGALILMTSFYILFSGRDGQWDIFTHSFMVGCCYFFIKMLNSYRNRLGFAIIGGLFLGASLLSKGPVSLYALFLPFIISYGVVYRFHQLKKDWTLIIILLIVGFASSGWWSIIVHYYDPEAFTEIAEKESGRWFNYNVRPIWYYWSFFTQSGIWTIPALMGLFYWYLKPRVSNLKAYRFYLLWTLGSVILLSIIPEKKSRYLLPVLIPLAMTTAFYVEYVIKNFRTNFTKREKLPIYLNFIVLLIIALATPFTMIFIFREQIWELPLSYTLFSISFSLLGIGIAYALYNKQIQVLFSIQVVMMVVLISFGFPLLQLISPDRNEPNIQDLKSFQAEKNIPLYDVTGLLPELVWEYGKPIPLAFKQEDLNNQPKTIGVLVSDKNNPDWQQKFENYNFKLMNTLDLNPGITKKKNFRLIRQLYVGTKK